MATSSNDAIQWMDSEAGPAVPARAPTTQDAIGWMDSGGGPVTPSSGDTKRPGFVESLGGAGEGLLHAATGGLGALGGGLTYLGTLAATGGDTTAADDVRQHTQEALTYKPRTVEGKKAEHDIDDIGSYLGQREGVASGDYVLDKTGSPVLAAAANTAANVPQFLIGGEGLAKGRVGFKVGAEAAAEAGTKAADIAPKPENFATDTKAAPAAEPTAGTPGSVSMERAKVLKSVGFDQARTSALTNDGPAGMSEYQTSRDPTTPQGLEAKKVFDNERATLNTHGESIVDDTGAAHPGLDGASLDAKGETILKPFEQMGDYFDAKRKAAYDAADERMGGQPVKLGGFKEALEDASNTTNQDSVGLRDGLRAYVKKLGIAGDGGSIAGTGTQAETVRKYINGNWSPANSKFAGTLKDALDDDVTKAAGSDVYKDARATVTLQKDTLENPTGIGSMLDSSGPNGINRKVAVGKVADHIASLPTAQLKHITDTLDKAPPEIQEAAQAAKAEIQGHMASRLMEAGNRTSDAWGHKAVNQYVDANSAKLPVVFGKDNPALAKIQNIRAAGNILRVDRSYPGAEIQGRILRSKIIPHGLAATGGALGGIVGSAVHAPGIGATVGTAAGAALGAKVAKGAGAAAVRQRMTDLNKPQ